jgi:hypothetical protein
MKYVSLIIIFLIAFLNASAQELALETSLDASVNETSGLLYINNTLITHNDSGNTNQLYDIDTTTGLVARTVSITNATNTDWEDITHDDTYIYIGDFGNNQGNRTNLKIYRIAIADYFNNSSVTAEIINFSYSSQTNFTPSPMATNFDAEGLIHYNNMLYVFSKNWLDGNTNIYELPKVPGTYSISTMDTIVAQGLVSGATHNTLDNSIILCGYGASGAFLIQLSAFNSGLFSNGTIIKTVVNIPENYSFQIEGIALINATDYYVSAEGNSNVAPGLFSFSSSPLSLEDAIGDHPILFYPNPAEGTIILNVKGFETEIYTIAGELVQTSDKKEIDISALATGTYLVKIKDSKSGNTTTKRLIVE